MCRSASAVQLYFLETSWWPTKKRFFPPELIDEVIEKTREHAAQEDYERELVRQKQHRFRDVYPLSPELRRKFEEERKRKQ